MTNPPDRQRADTRYREKMRAQGHRWITVRLSPLGNAWLEELMEETGQTRSAAIEDALRVRLNK